MIHVLNDVYTANKLGLLPIFQRTSTKYGIPLEYLLAIASRESCMTRCLDDQWKGDFGNGYGIMQIDKRWHPEFTSNYAPTDHEKNIDYAGQLLAQAYDKFQTWEPTLASYNAGIGGVSRAIAQGLHPDEVTTGKNYSKDVMNRAEYVRILTGTKNIDSNLLFALGGLGLAGFLAWRYYR